MSGTGANVQGDSRVLSSEHVSSLFQIASKQNVCSWQQNMIITGHNLLSDKITYIRICVSSSLPMVQLWLWTYEK